jgi:hypothetical protein
LLSAFAAAEASAQITGGTPLNLAPGVIDRNNIAFDNVNDVYLIIVQRPPVVGRFVNKNGVPLGPDFQISLEPGDPFVAWVSIAFGGPANDPTFLVTYTLADLSLNPKYARFVRYVPGGAPAVSAPIFITNITTEYNQSEKAQNFWNGQHWLIGTRVRPPGSTFPGPQVDILQTNGTVAGSRYFGDDLDFYGSPSLTCASNGTCIIIGFAAGANTGFSGGTYVQRFNGTTLAPLGILGSLASGNANEDQGVVYRSHLGDFLAQWFRGGGSFGFIDTRTIGTDGSLGPLDLNRGIGPGAGTNAIAYNPASATSLLVTKWTAASLVVMELGDDGYPRDVNNTVLITNWDNLVPNYTPSMASNADDAQWLVSAMLSAGPVGRVIQGVPANDLVQNGTFSGGLTSWTTFAQPSPTDLVTSINNGVLSFYRVPPPPGVPSQGVVLQGLNTALAAETSLTAVFDLGNSSTVRKRITILLHDLDFSDLAMCTFWLAPGAPLRTYRINTHTNHAWDNATISFYAASTGSNGGAYLLDNVHAYQTTGAPLDRTECLDPTTPAPVGVPDGANLLTNGDFNTGVLAPWGTFGQITFQITGGVFQFFRPAGTPAGVVLQPANVGLPLQTRFTLTVGLGNSSGVRKRVTVLIHDLDFSDLAACTFWLEPGQPIAQHTMKALTTRVWTNATVAVYPANVEESQWILLDDVSLRTTPGAPMNGTDCIEPAGSAPGASRMSPGNYRGANTSQEAAADAGLRRPADVVIAPARGVVLAAPLDLRDARSPVLQFDSLLRDDHAQAFVEVTRDGITWVRVASIPPSEDWRSVTVDLSGFGGNVVYVRFVHAGAPGSEPWACRSVQWRECHSCTSRSYARIVMSE